MPADLAAALQHAEGGLRVVRRPALLPRRLGLTRPSLSTGRPSMELIKEPATWSNVQLAHALLNQSRKQSTLSSYLLMLTDVSLSLSFSVCVSLEYLSVSPV